METRDPRVDAYIEQARPFAQPILRKLRAAVHATAPDARETIKWGVPHFERRRLLCGMAAFTEHCTFGFWKGELVTGETPDASRAMGQLGRIATLDDLPDEEALAAYLRRAVELDEAGVPAPRARPAPRPDAEPPADLLAALDDAARAAWAAFSPSARREYVEWIEEAKTDATRSRRIATAAAWIAEGKGRNWKYERPRRAAP